ncbi:hypothetical protein AGR3A_Lc110010 [Agrobacterium tomkonis CFBP 6623]|uniref:Uncharacterized protein n=1 Tax=Agrobacterium tomkonis CFBP 6623 TaxID=1183432 RepID=A0A1S7QVV8_9HYPH|nr:hypothetical protein AGR3A_Lc110010 [Agrobacterium tomkonis CFBP 6623]
MAALSCFSCFLPQALFCCAERSPSRAVSRRGNPVTPDIGKASHETPDILPDPVCGAFTARSVAGSFAV